MMGWAQKTSFRSFLAAVASGLAVALCVHFLTASGVVAALARDLAAATGFPLDRAVGLGAGGFWLSALLAGWVAWVCLNVRSLGLQCVLLAVAVGLCVTGSWVAALAGGAFPAVPVILGLVGGFILGQIAAGFLGDANRRNLEAALAGDLDPSQRQTTLGQEVYQEGCRRDCLAAIVDAPDTDRGYLPIVRAGLVRRGAWVREDGGGRLRIAFGMLGREPTAGEALAALAEAAVAMAARPAQPWTLACATGPVSARLEEAPSPRLLVRGAVWPRMLGLVEEGCGSPDGFRWLVAGPEVEPPAGWEAVVAAAGVVRWVPARRPVPAPTGDPVSAGAAVKPEEKGTPAT